MPYRKPIQDVSIELPLRHEEIHQGDEAAVGIGTFIRREMIRQVGFG
jgi:hypothetical protein